METYDLLGVDKETDICNILLSYQSKLYLSNIKETDKTFKQLTDAKNKLLRFEINNQVRENGRFKIQIPYTHFCQKCNGFGEIYRIQEYIIVPCSICKGTGIIYKKCQSCNGTGRFKKYWNGLTINVECKSCKKSGRKEFTCVRCCGTGKVKRLVFANRIVEHTECEKCRGSGINQNFISSLLNPVLPIYMADIIKNLKEGANE